MRCTFLLALLCTYALSFSQDIHIYFAPNSSVLRINDAGKLEELITAYRKNKFTIDLRGHADTTGTKDYNLDLSRKRVNSIKSFLANSGIPVKDIHTAHFGESLAQEPDQFYNRRVEIVVKKPKESKITSYSGFIESIQPQTEQFSIPVETAVRIEGKKGTVITIPDAAFQFSDGTPATGTVNISLTEYYTLSDFISQRLSTISNGNLLVTNGMVNIIATKDSKELELKSGKEIELSFPKSDTNRFFTFYADRQPDGRMNWVLDKELWERAQHDIGVIPNADGSELIITDRKTADYANKLIVFDSGSNSFKQLTPEEKKAFDVKLIQQQKEREKLMEQYRKEQEKIWKSRDQFYTTIYSKRVRMINCDEYIRDPSSEIIEYFASVKDSGMTLMNAYLIFGNRRSILELSKPSDTRFYINARLPRSGPVQLLATAMKKDKLYIFYGPVSLGNKTEAISLKESSFEELTAIIKN